MRSKILEASGKSDTGRVQRGLFKDGLDTGLFERRGETSRRQRRVEDDVKISNLGLHKGHCVEVRGRITKNVNRFAVNLGRDAKNLIMHCNPRFDYSVDKDTIILNAKINDVWGTEQKEPAFPFKAGSETLLIFDFDDCITVHLPDGKEIKFACRFPIDVVNYLDLCGLELTSITVR
uniref:Galectin n=1 Tax=Xenopus tropicalis TaxID=8364 RepID=A0A803K5H6_XENTR